MIQNFIKNSWQTVLTVVSVTTVITTIVTFDNRYVKPREIEIMIKRLSVCELEISKFNTKFEIIKYPKDEELRKKIHMLENQISDLQIQLAQSNTNVTYNKEMSNITK